MKLEFWSYMYDRWFLILPDILVFFTIFGFGVLTGVCFFLLFILTYCWKGGTITVKHETKENS
tara:strand:- start:34 stop:222 length:189 start_codon:yes stop_codon:yes gene_type:complete